MKTFRSALAGLLALFVASAAVAQTFPTVPDNSVIGRLGKGGQSGPSQAIPNTTLFSQMLTNFCTSPSVGTVLNYVNVSGWACFNNGQIPVEACGAVGDGTTTGDAAKIRTCAAIAGAKTLGGKVLFACNKTYLLDTKDANSTFLPPYSNVTYEGCGASSVLKVANNMNTAGSQFYVIYPPAGSTINNFTARNFKIDFNGANNSCSGTCYYNNIGIGVFNGSNIVIDGVTFLNNPGSQDIAINGLNGVGVVAGVRIANTLHLDVCDIVNAACTDHSSMFVAANDYIISNNTCRNATQSTKSTCWEQWGVNGTASANTVDKYHRMANVPATTFGGSTRNQVITGNVGNSLGTGVVIWCDGVSSSTISDIRIDGNSFNQQSGAGAFVFHDWDTTITADCAKNLYYTNNNFTSSVAAGAAANPFTLRLGRAFNQVVSGNNFTNGGGPAIGNGTFSASTSIAVNDNSITDAGQTSTAAGRRGILISSATVINKASVSRNQIQNVASSYMTTGMDLTINSTNSGWVESNNLITNVATPAALALSGNMIPFSVAGLMFNRGAGQPYGNIVQCTDGQLVIGQTAGAPNCVTVSGDVTINNLGVTAIGTAKVTFAMMQNMAALSVLGRPANSVGVMSNITATAGSGAILRESGSTIGFGTISTNTNLPMSTGLSCGVIAQNSTVYTGPSTGCLSATEANWQVPVSSAFTLKNLRVNATSTPAAGQTFTMTVRKNGASAGVTCQIPNPATTCSDLSNTASFAAGDLIDLQIVTSATSGSVNAINTMSTAVTTSP